MKKIELYTNRNMFDILLDLNKRGLSLSDMCKSPHRILLINIQFDMKDKPVSNYKRCITVYNGTMLIITQFCGWVARCVRACVCVCARILTTAIHCCVSHLKLDIINFCDLLQLIFVCCINFL